jgi:hypothetical protein
MMNLLPEEQQKKLSHERIRRLFLVVGLSLSLILSFGVVLTLPTYFLLLSQRGALAFQLDAIGEDPALKEIDEIEKNINDFNNKLVSFERNEKSVRSASFLIKEVIKIRPATISFKNITYKRDLQPNSEIGSRTDLEQIVIQGEALRRDDLLNFVTKLEEVELFENINLPVSSLLKDSGVEFSLTINLNAP